MEPLLSYLKCCVVIYMDGGGEKKTKEDAFMLMNFRVIDTSEASSLIVEQLWGELLRISEVISK